MSDLPLSKKELAELMRLAHSPAGKQLIAYLKQNNGAALQQAVDLAAAGNYQEAKKLGKELLSSPRARELLDQLGR